MAKISEIFKMILTKLGLSKNEPKKIEASKNNGRSQKSSNLNGYKMNEAIVKLEKKAKPQPDAQYKDGLKEQILGLTQVNELLGKDTFVENIQKLKPSIDTLNQAIDLHPEIQDDIENIIRRLANDDHIKSIYQGNIKSLDETNIFYAIRETNNQDKITIIIPGKGIQEVTYNGEKEKYEIRKGTKTFAIESEKQKNGDKQANTVFFSKKIVDSYFDVLIRTGGNKKLRNLGIQNEEEYADAVIKETGIFTKDGSDSASYLELYKNRKAKSPERLALSIDPENYVYGINQKTNKYSNISNSKDPEITLEEFEERMDRIYGIPSITNSSLNDYFNKGNFQIPTEIKQITEVIRALEEQERNKSEFSK